MQPGLSTPRRGKMGVTEGPQPHALQPCEHRGALSRSCDCSFQRIFGTADRAASSHQVCGAHASGPGDKHGPAEGSQASKVESPPPPAALGEVWPGGPQHGLRVPPPPPTALPLPGWVTWGRGFNVAAPSFPYLENKENHLHHGVVMRIV